MKSEKLKFIDVSGEAAGENMGDEESQLDEIIALTHDALLIAVKILSGEVHADEQIIARLNKKISDLLLAHRSSQPADVLTEPENEAVNAISTRGQPGINEVFVYSSGLYVSMKARLRSEYYKLFFKNLDLYKKNFLNEYCSALKRYFESNDFTALLDLQALSRSFLDQGIYKLDSEFDEIGKYARKIYAFCSMNLIKVVESEPMEQTILESLLQRLQFMRDQCNARITSNN